MVRPEAFPLTRKATEVALPIRALTIKVKKVGLRIQALTRKAPEAALAIQVLETVLLAQAEV